MQQKSLLCTPEKMARNLDNSHIDENFIFVGREASHWLSFPNKEIQRYALV